MQNHTEERLVRQEPVEIREEMLDLVSGGIGVGIDPNGRDAGSFMDPNG